VGEECKQENTAKIARQKFCERSQGGGGQEGCAYLVCKDVGLMLLGKLCIGQTLDNVGCRDKTDGNNFEQPLTTHYD